MISKGLRLPVGVDATGGTAMVDGETANRQIIMTALSDCDSENAFQQDLGVGSDMVFDISDPTARAKTLQKLRLIFDKFEAEHRFRLLPETARWTVDQGELTLEFMYHDIESDQDLPFYTTFGA